MRVAVYSHSIAPSIDGVCRRFTGLLQELSDQGHDLLLFTLESSPEDLPIKLTDWVTLEHMGIPSYPEKKIAMPTASSLLKIWSALARFKPDVVHVTSDGFSPSFALVCWFLGIPIVGSFHTDVRDLLVLNNANSFQICVCAFKEKTDSFILNSCATTSISFSAKLKRQGLICDHVIITAVDTNTFSKEKRNSSLRSEMLFGDTSPGAFLCVYVGRISREKRIDVIAEAVKNIPGAYLAIVGDGPLAAYYAAMHGKDNRIYCKPAFLSHAELAEVYASGDIHISGSQFETLGNTVLEAFACGVPVVVPRCQGFCDTVEDTLDGYLFTPGSSSSAQQYIQLLKDDPVKRAAMGEYGRKVVATRTVSHVVKDLVGWYRQGMEKHSRTSLIAKIIALATLLPTVPIVIIAGWGYVQTMAILLSVFGYSPIQKHPSVPSTPHTTPVAEPLTPDSESKLENEKKGSMNENPIPLPAVISSGMDDLNNSDIIGKVEETARRRKTNSSGYAAETEDQRATTDAQ